MARTRGKSVAVLVFSEHRSFILGSFIGVPLSLLPFMILVSYHYSVQLNPVSCGLAGQDRDSMVASESADQQHPKSGREKFVRSLSDGKDVLSGSTPVIER